MQMLLTLSDVASRLQVHVQTVRHYITEGQKVGVMVIRLKASRLGHSYRIRPEDLDEFIKVSSKF